LLNQTGRDMQINRNTRLTVATLSMLFITILVSILSFVMGRGGSDTPILNTSWIFVPSPLILLALIYIHKISRLIRVAAKIYIGLSVIVTVLLLLGVAWTGSETALHPEICEDMEELSDYPNLAKNTENVEFKAADGTLLKGWINFGTSTQAILLLHGYRCDKRAMLKEANMLYETGFTVLLFDFRHNGESEGDFVTFGYYEKQDVTAAINKLRNLDAERHPVKSDRLTSIGILGQSNGGATALLFAAENPGAIQAMVVDSSFKSLDSAVAQSFTHFVGLPAFPFAPITVWITELKTGISRKDIVPEEAVKKITNTPIFIIHGLLDKTISKDDSESIFANANEPKQLWLVPDADHGETFTAGETEYSQRVVRFFTRALN